MDAARWVLWGLWLAWRSQSRAVRSAEIGLPLLLAGLIVAMSALPSAPVQRVQAQQVQTSPDASPSPSPDTSPSPDPGPAVETVTSGRSYHAPGCGAIPVPGPLSASYYPRVVIPHVGINVEIHPGDGGTPPDNQWVAWLYPGLSHPGEAGNSYVYAHAHGQPQGSAPGLFWPLHYMRNCDAVYVYTSATNVIRYQAVSVELAHPGRDLSPLNQTNDERLTLQTCNDWNPYGPKTIVTAVRYVDPPPPAPPSSTQPPAGSGSGGGGPSPQPTPSPTPKPLITIPPLHH
jgi:sortase (surface protein transpeptidase)